jgi:hypothetical protein
LPLHIIGLVIPPLDLSSPQICIDLKTRNLLFHWKIQDSDD